MRVVQMITFEQIIDKNLYIAREMMNSNASYFQKRNNKKSELEEELISLASNPNAHLIKVDDTYIGIISYRLYEEEQLVSLDLLMIHADYQGFGYGTSVYYEFEDLLTKLGYTYFNLHVYSENTRAKQFWERNGFTLYTSSQGEEMAYYKKQLK